jgi:hypothetical protein
MKVKLQKEKKLISSGDDSRKFNYSLDYSQLNLRRKKSLYRVGRGEQGVLLVQPYKSEILPYWKFRDPGVAKKSSRAILKLFRGYCAKDDFIGMDMCRKFLQMGYTRSRRYANHKSGKKYVGPVPTEKRGQSGSHGREIAAYVPDTTKAESANVFFQAWKKVEGHRKYKKMKIEWKQKYG